MVKQKKSTSFTNELLKANLLTFLIIFLLGQLSTVVNGVFEILYLFFIAPVVLPIYLFYRNQKIANCYKKKSFLTLIGVIFSIVVLVYICIYVSWAMQTNRLMNPDGETLYLFQSAMSIALFVIIVGALTVWQLPKQK